MDDGMLKQHAPTDPAMVQPDQGAAPAAPTDRPAQDPSSSSASHVQGDQQPIEEPRNNLIVNYIPPGVGENELRSLFAPFGNIKTVKLMTDRATGKSLGYGFVEFEATDEATQAIQALNGRQYMKKRLKVSIARPSSSAITGANLYIKNLPQSITDEQLREVFRPYGEIISSRLLYDSDVPKGIAFVRYDKRMNAERAVTELSNSTPPGFPQPIVVKFADNNRRSRHSSSSSSSSYMNHNMMGYGMNMHPSYGAFPHMQPGAVPMSPDLLPPSARSPFGFCLFVYNVPPVFDDTALASVFSNFGQVVTANISRKSLTQAKRYGFVTMRDFQEAAMAVQNLNEREIYGFPLKVSFKSERRRSRSSIHGAQSMPSMQPQMYMSPYVSAAMGPHSMPMQMPMQGGMQAPMQGMQGMQGGMQGMQGGMQGGMPGGMQGAIQGGMQGAMPGGMQGGMQAPMQGGMQGGMQAPTPMGMGAPPAQQHPMSPGTSMTQPPDMMMQGQGQY